MALNRKITLFLTVEKSIFAPLFIRRNCIKIIFCHIIMYKNYFYGTYNACLYIVFTIIIAFHLI